ncbi:ATPase [Campylobacterota bacterium]|nr:ATPase [Campylobacterota bacterium]
MWADKESEKDYLNFGEVAEIATDIIASPSMLPVSIGIFGNWGSGKSSILKLIENNFKNENEKYLIINFDAWLYQGYDDARMSLMETIVSNLQQEAKDNETVLTKIKSLFSRISYLRLVGLAGEGIALINGIPTGGAIAKAVNALSGLKDGIQAEEEYQTIGTTVKSAKEKIGGIIKPLEEKSPPQHIDAFRVEYKDIIKELEKTVVVIIDNLDRCTPVNAIQTLEAIRLFLFLQNTAFVIAADEDMIRSAVKECFKGSNEQHQIDYLDKLIQVPVRVPKLGIREVRAYLFMLYAVEHEIEENKVEELRLLLENNMRSSWKDEPIDREKLLKILDANDKDNLSKSYLLADRTSLLLTNSTAIQGNPRIIKRLLNIVKMRSQTAKRRGISLDETIITKLVIFERCVGSEITSDFYRLVDTENGKPAFLQLDYKGKAKAKIPEAWKNESVKAFVADWLKLEPLLNKVDLRPALYLSRETRALSISTKELSSEAKDILVALSKVKNMSTLSISEKLKSLMPDEEVKIMETLIEQLRQISDWSKIPEGFNGACILADISDNAGKLLNDFIHELGTQKNPWLENRLKTSKWYR